MIESLSCFTKKEEQKVEEERDSLTVMQEAEDIFKNNSDIKEAKLLTEALKFAEAIVDGNEEVEVLLA